MKRITVLAIVLLAGCQTLSIPDSGTVSVCADSDPAAKTALNGTSVVWKSTDALSVFYGSSNSRFTTTGSGTSASFTGDAPEMDSYFVLYPYDSRASVSDGVISTSLPSIQTAVPGSFADGANVSAGISARQPGGHKVTMRNVGCYFKFTVGTENAVKSLKITAAGGESVSGEISIKVTSDAPVTEAGGPSYVISQPSGSCFDAGTYYAVLAPAVLGRGLSITVTNADGTAYTRNFETLEKIERNRVYVLSCPVEQKKFNIDVEDLDFPFETYTAGSESIGEEKSLLDRPYLLVDREDFGKMRMKALNAGSFFGKFNISLMSEADKIVESAEAISYPAAGQTPLDALRPAVKKLSFLAYAYRMTGDEKYLTRAEAHLKEACELKDWCPKSSFLATAELAFAVSLAYDWLYDDLSSSTRADVEGALKSKILDIYPDYRSQFVDHPTNWNQVCYAGVVSAAISCYGPSSEICKSIVSEAVNSLNKCIPSMYGSGSGVYPEGPSYWSYGTSFQILINTLLEHSYGTDYGMSDDSGFRNTGRFISFSNGSVQKFNFSDCSAPLSNYNELCYFATKFGNYDCLWQLFNSTVSAADRTDVLHAIWASKVDESKVGPGGDDLLFYADKGSQQMIMARSGWKKNSTYVGLKGGRPSNNHGHMDTGTLVYDYKGYRWIQEPPTPDYSSSEAALAAIGKDLWSMRTDSYRWHIMGYNNRWHSTLTINENNISVSGMGTATEKINTSAGRGGTIDITDAYGSDNIALAKRTAVIVLDGNYLRLTDVLKAPAGKPASVQFRIWTAAEPTVTGSGITLKQYSTTVTLETTGADVTYTEFSTNPADYESVLDKAGSLQKQPSERYCVGYTVTIPANMTYTLVTTIK